MIVETTSVTKFFTSKIKNSSVAIIQGTLCGMTEKAKEKRIMALTIGYSANLIVVSVDMFNREARVRRFTYAARTLSPPSKDTIISWFYPLLS